MKDAMLKLAWTAMPTEEARAWRGGAPDAYGMPPERAVSDGGANPCRHCLRDIPEGAGMLILAHRPFPKPDPYAETGPIFLCADECPRHDPAAPPAILGARAAFLVKGYRANDRIFYGTGRITPSEEVDDYCARLLEDPEVAYVHVRSATNNCYQFRVDRG